MRRTAASTDLRLEHATSIETLGAASSGWNDLAEAVGCGPFQTLPWIAAHVRHRLGPGETFTCHLAWRGDALVGVLPLVRKRSVLRVPSHFHTRDGEPLLAPTDARHALAGLLEHVLETHGCHTCLCMGGIGPTSPVRAALRGVPMAVFRSADLTGRHLVVRAPWETHRETLSKNFRRNLRKSRSRAEREGLAFSGIDDEPASPAVAEDFLDLEASGWKGREGEAIRKSETSVAFYRDVVRGFAKAGWLRCPRVMIRGRLAASQLGVRVGRRLTLLKVAYDETLARFAPGNLLFDELMTRITRAGKVDRVDCVTDMPWHDSWGMARITYASARLHPWQAGALFLGVLPDALRALARRLLLRNGRHGPGHHSHAIDGSAGEA